MRKNTLIVILFVLLFCAGIWGIIQNDTATKYKMSTEQNYDRDFNVLLATLKDMYNKLDKCGISTDDSFLAKSFADISKLAATSQEMLTRLPLSHVTTSQTTEFLSKVEDFSSAMLTEILDGGVLSDENRNALAAVTNSSKLFLDEMYAFHEEVAKDGSKFKWDSGEKEYYFDEAKENITTKSFTSMNEDFVEYPSMIYDGPFSDSLKNPTPKGLSGADTTKEEIEAKINALLGDGSGLQLTYNGEAGGDIPSHSFTVTEGDNSLYLMFTKTGGHLLSATCSKQPASEMITMDEALVIAQEFLKKTGVDTMTPTYHEKYNNIGTFNFAYIQDDVTVYSDLIKVQVSLEDGSVIGYEAEGYYMSHTIRDMGRPSMSLEQAQKFISADLSITHTALALIPTKGKQEILCYEFKGTVGDQMYIIYIDAQTGKEEQIFRVIEADQSVLVL